MTASRHLLTLDVTSVTIFPMAATKRPGAKNSAAEFQSFLQRKKITAAELEKRVGIPRMTTWRWCNGKVKPSRMARRLLDERLGFKWKD